MGRYAYNALDADGRAAAGVVDAASRAEAIALLAARQVFVIDIDTSREDDAGAAIGGGLLDWRAPRLTGRAKATMLRQLATALQAGLPLLPALRGVTQQAATRGQRVVSGDLADRVQAGESLSAAMDAHPESFTRLEISMARVGETAGVLEEVMGYLSDFAERDLDIRRKVRSAATYPLFVLALAIVSVVVIVTVVLPPVIAVVTEGVATAELPLPTRVLMASGSFLRTWWVGLSSGLVLGGWALRRWMVSPDGRLAIDGLKLRVPLLGSAVRKVAVARFARTLGTLSKSGIGILEALHVLRDTLDNEVLARHVDRVAAEITKGDSIADPLRQTGQFPPLLIQVTAMGERTGRLDELLLQTAEAYEKETAAAVDRAMTILPALLIVVLAVVVAFVLSAVLLPIVTLDIASPGL